MKTEMADSINIARAPFLVRVIWYWMPVLMTCGVMYYFSTDVLSNDNTRGVIDKILLWFEPHASDYALESFNTVIRKSAHFVEYAILGAFLFRAFRGDSPMRWGFRWAVYSFFSAASWGLLDEFHQTLTRSRDGSIWDSLLDSCGALFALTLIALYTTRDRTPRSSGTRRPTRTNRRNDPTDQSLAEAEQK